MNDEMSDKVIEALVAHVTAPDARKKLDDGWFVCLTCGETVHRTDKQHRCYVSKPIESDEAKS